MAFEHHRIAELLSRYLHDEISSCEKEELLKYAEKYESIKSWLSNKEEKLTKAGEYLEKYNEVDLEVEWLKITNRKKERGLRWYFSFKWFSAAASILLIVTLGSYYFFKTIEPTTKQLEIVDIAEIVPGKNQASLVLSDGSSIALNGNKDSIYFDGSVLLDVNHSELNYSEGRNIEVLKHTLKVPVGGTYKVILADGTKVWLNADSELEFPTAFKGEERRVRIKGEAYFEIAKDANRPFRVEVGDSEIQAIGTAFNINSHLFANKIKTILTEGKIKVSSKGKSQFVIAGHACISGEGHIELKEADLEEALAWKDGYFYFDSKDLKAVLAEIGRWYDLEVETHIQLSTKRYKGGIKKTESILQVCEILNGLTGYHYEINNRKLIVK